jgi:hypothetical protein
MVEIYALCDPSTMEIRYVGKANNAAKRLASHMRASRDRKTPVYAWIRKHGTPALKVLLVCEDEHWCDYERRIIAGFRDSGVRLLNVADGGDEPKCSLETRRNNGRIVAKLRPQGIILAYRMLESTIRESRRWFPHKTQKLIAVYERFKVAVSVARKNGTLGWLNERCLESFGNHERKERQAIRLQPRVGGQYLLFGG